LLDQLRPSKLTDCDVPLATLYWTATGGLVWLDMWSVRRRVTHCSAATAFDALRDVRRSNSEAMVLQFEEQIATTSRTDLGSLVATDAFTFLPPIGILPAVGGAKPGVLYSKFFQETKHLPPAHIEGARLHELCRKAMRHSPIHIADQELIRLYLVRENRQAFEAGTAGQPALLFVNGHVPDYSHPHFDLAYCNYANFA
jgi:hypothetical protein